MICTGPGLVRGPYMGWYMRGDFFPMGWHMRCDFSEPDQHMIIFRMGRADKKRNEFLTAGSGYKKSKTNNIASQSWPTKQKRSFETGG